MIATLSTLLFSLAAAPVQEQPTGDAFVLWSAGIEALAPDERDAGFVSGLLGLEELLDTLGEGLDTPLPMFPRVAARWAHRPLDLRFGITAEGAPRLHVAIEFDSLEEAEDQTAAARDLFTELGVELSASSDSPSSFWGTTPEGPMTLTAAARGERGALVMTINARPDVDVARPSLAALGEREPAWMTVYDGAQLLRGMRKLADEESAGDPEQARKNQLVFSVLDRLDLVGADTPRRTWAVSHGPKESMTLRHVDGWANSFAARRGVTDVGREHVALIPRDAVWAWLGNAHPSVLTEVAREVEPEQVAQALGMAAAMTGVDLEQDLLGNIGPVCGAYAASSSGPSALTGLVLFAKSDDAEAVADALETLIDAIPVPPEERPFQVETWSHEGLQCTSVAFPGMPVPVEPSFCASGDVVFLAMGRNALRQALDQASAETSLLDHPRFAKLSERVFKDLIGFSFLDSPACVQKGYGTLSMLLAGLNNAGRAHGAPDLSQLLPTGAKLAGGMRPTLSLEYRRGEDLLGIKAHDRSWIARTAATVGSPVGELNPMMTSMVAAVAIPNLLSARLSANESAAIATLRSIASAEQQFQAMTVVDSDGDGRGEYGLFGELSAGHAPRGRSEPIRIPVLSSAFGQLTPITSGGAVVTRSGYHFQVWLPGERGAVCDGGAGPSGAVDGEAAEQRWCAYAWPVQAQSTGNRSFYVDQKGEIWFEASGSYSGLDSVPNFDAAGAKPGSFGVGPQEAGAMSVDGNHWMLVD